MKTKTKILDYKTVSELPIPEHKKPQKPNPFLRWLVRTLSKGDLKKVRFSYTKNRMDEAGDGPWLVLMNHSSFIDLEIATELLKDRPYSIVCTSDGLVGKERIMRSIGCIPTQKFVSDLSLVGDMKYAMRELGCSVLMYPEASYTFDGCATPLPRRLGVILKTLGVPVVTIITKGAFARDPLYNCLQVRDVTVSAEMTCLFTAEEIKSLPSSELERKLDEAFTFDNFKWQQENNIIIDAPFRADGLNRILYKCAHCKEEGHMIGEGTKLKCTACGKEYELTETGFLKAFDGKTEFPHIPDWYAWERKCVKEELEEGSYKLDIPVDIRMMVDYNGVYEVGSGRLLHTNEGFHLTGCDGQLDYTQSPMSSYGLYADYYWYELGDMICIGNKNALYYCFPKEKGDVVAKTRLAAEELYKICFAARRAGRTNRHDQRAEAEGEK